jgi:imidazoleglycerol-phosphate dehydratase
MHPHKTLERSRGRKIDSLHPHPLTSAVETFFQSLAEHSGLEISLIKIRGDNEHHVVESAFKAFSDVGRK